MSLRGHVSSNIGGRSEIKNLINELITEIECAAATPPTQFGSEQVRGKVLNLLPG